MPNETTIDLDPLVDAVARQLYVHSLKRDYPGGPDRDWDALWGEAKRHYAIDPTLYTRPAHAIEDALEAVAIVMSTENTTSYGDALDGLAVRDMDGNVRHPQCALVRFEDGWRLFSRFAPLDDRVRTTSYVIDPEAALREIGDQTDGR